MRFPPIVPPWGPKTLPSYSPIVSFPPAELLSETSFLTTPIEPNRLRGKPTLLLPDSVVPSRRAPLRNPVFDNPYRAKST